MSYYFPFGETVKPLVQEDRTPKKVFVLGIYASAVHARWMDGTSIKCNALAVASEPRIFWDGNPKEAAEIISRIKIPQKMGTLEPADEKFKGQNDAIEREYDKVREKYGLNEVTIPKRPSRFCNSKRCEEIVAELEESKAELLVLLGDIPIKQFLNVVANVNYKSLQEYKERYGYGIPTDVTINGRHIKVLPLAHPRQIGGLGSHSNNWYNAHQEWELHR